MGIKVKRTQQQRTSGVLPYMAHTGPYAAGPGIVFELSVLNIHSSKAWRTKAKEIILRHIGLYSPKPEAT